MSLSTLEPTRRLADLRALVDQFYADHFHLLDEGRAEEWAAMFAPDGVFHMPSRPEPVRGREALAAGVRAAHAARQADGEQHRHWHGMVSVREEADGVVAARCYALILATPAGGTPRAHLSCVCEDRFVVEDDRLLLAERRVRRDGAPEARG